MARVARWLFGERRLNLFDAIVLALVVSHTDASLIGFLIGAIVIIGASLISHCAEHLVREQADG